ncbi:hypothetical protein WJX72_001877 [[Myrmecia] bisecta]|uniref:Uncharacterized protein n=1 Tax=[Myrmecia] bisecta TaxID=41462 RepID=A0AAW1QPE6_9CHLO
MAGYDIKVEPNDDTLKAIAQLLNADKESIQAQGAAKVQLLAKQHCNFVLDKGLQFIPVLIGLLEAELSEARTAAAAALAALAIEPAGREILRREGCIRPLVLQLEEGIHSTAAEQAVVAIMSLAACEINKDAIREAEGIPALVRLMHEATGQSAPTAAAAAIQPLQLPKAAALQGTGAGGSQPHRNTWQTRHCINRPAAASAAGALMNLQLNPLNRTAMEEAGIVNVLERILAAGYDNILTQRAKFMLTWLNMEVDQTDFNPRPTKTFDDIMKEHNLKLDDGLEGRSSFDRKLPLRPVLDIMWRQSSGLGRHGGKPKFKPSVPKQAQKTAHRTY